MFTDIVFLKNLLEVDFLYFLPVLVIYYYWSLKNVQKVLLGLVMSEILSQDLKKDINSSLKNSVFSRGKVWIILSFGSLVMLFMVSKHFLGFKGDNEVVLNDFLILLNYMSVTFILMTCCYIGYQRYELVNDLIEKAYMQST